MIKAITGTKDILPSEISRWHYLENLLRETFKTFNYKEIRTPIFEETALFARGIGEETDIVSKEMYTFKDRSETSITLRPENTAGVVRSFIEQSLGAQQSLNKLYYIGAMFRQERPQAGRLRQFHQFGAEALGSNSPLLDAEMIQIAFNILKNLGLKNLSVKINSIGTPDVREKYKFFLRKYLEDKKDKLSEESRKRFDTNILRIFDSKIEVDQQIMKDAPSLLRFLPEESIKDFEIVKNYLFKVGIPIEIDSTLVRGLDYYTLTTFEIVSGSVGSQSALCGGGRYDLLVQELGGKFTPGVGFAAGMERILLACENEKSLKLPNDSIDVYLIRINDDLKVKSEFELEIANLASNLRIENLSCDYDYHDRSVKAQMREANKFNAKFVVFVGGDEYTRGELNVKNLSNGEQQLIKINDFEKLKMLLKS
ncbi:MAG TPA: histidine--tRNA ligase [Ignavibacteriaceae bacterium]|nr:histidine--tRNA ligase [Ignavibacterium sp.]HRN27329.1 histidine--tRNA ligase [Ignavibacteriaceae bacterium]HRP93616.1 histidine--tRNA ligase [Ignavibacteriaceae bacterium]HRQ54972.1 histidine--tRNA ligase [Ignavibacteriaceae bacterium]